MAPGKEYQNFDVVIEKSGEQYRARVISSPCGQAAVEFGKPFSPFELENFVLRMGRPRSGMRRIDSPEMQAAKDLGERLFSTVFSGEVNSCYLRSIDNVLGKNQGLRLRLHINVPEFNDYPWEFMYNPQFGQFVALSQQTPIIRYIELPYTTRALPVQIPLKILVMISSPDGYPKLDTEKEWENLSQALKPLIDRKMVVLEKLERPTLRVLQKKLRQDRVHIFHYIGHGKYFEDKQDGMLLLEDENGRGKPTNGQHLGAILHNHYPLRLVVLNACEGARTSAEDPYAGVAHTLVQQGIPAVLAMQFEIFEDAAMTFAEEFYSAIVDNYPVDAALSEARLAIFASNNDVEWGTPVLFMRTPDGTLFRPESAEERAARLDEEIIHEERKKKEAEERGRLAQEAKEREAAEKAAREKAKREAAKKAAKEKAEREAAEKATKEKAEREAAEKTEQEGIEREEAEKVERERIERERLEREEKTSKVKEAAEIAARENAEREAAKKAEQEKKEPTRLAREEKSRKEKEAAEKAAKEKAIWKAIEGTIREKEVPEAAGKVITQEAGPQKETWTKNDLWTLLGAIGIVILAIFLCGYAIKLFYSAITGGMNLPATQTPTMVVPMTSNTPLPPTPSPAAEEPLTAPEEPTGELGVGSTMISEKDGMLMVYVPAGEFQMGNENGDPNEIPVHTVYLDGFWIDQTEVTNGMFVAFLNAKGNQSESGFTWFVENDEMPIEKVENTWQVDFGYEDHPVVNVIWYGARAYCDWAYRRLPTEAEWEKAARGGLEGKIFPWGNIKPVCDPGAYNGAQVAGCADNTVTVGSFGQNRFGIYDMAGNVWEWVSSLNRPYPYVATDGRENLNSSGYRVKRGGSWFNFLENNPPGGSIRISYRAYKSANQGDNRTGFRCARDAN